MFFGKEVELKWKHTG